MGLPQGPGCHFGDHRHDWLQPLHLVWIGDRQRLWRRRQLAGAVGWSHDGTIALAHHRNGPQSTTSPRSQHPHRSVTPLAAGAAHTAFEWFAIFIGARLYLRSGKTSLRELGATRNYAVVLGCIVGAAIGNKAVHWIHHADHWPLLRESPWLILRGQSIVGGLLGGLIGVELGKLYAG